MKYIILILITFFLFFIIALFTLHLPTNDRYVQGECSVINATHTLGDFGCKDIIFQDTVNGECFFDKTTENITRFPIDWLPLLVIIGANFVVILILFLCFSIKTYIG